MSRSVIQRAEAQDDLADAFAYIGHDNIGEENGKEVILVFDVRFDKKNMILKFKDGKKKVEMRLMPGK